MSIIVVKEKFLLLTSVSVKYIFRYFSLFCLQIRNAYLIEKTSSTVSNYEYLNQTSECRGHYASNTPFRSV